MFPPHFSDALALARRREAELEALASESRMIRPRPARGIGVRSALDRVRAIRLGEPEHRRQRTREARRA
jgi:hypothetical protein